MDEFDRLRHILTKQRQDLAEHISAGGAADYVAYSKAVGAIQTLDMVLAEITDIEKKQLED